MLYRGSENQCSCKWSIKLVSVSHTASLSLSHFWDLCCNYSSNLLFCFPIPLTPSISPLLGPLTFLPPLFFSFPHSTSPFLPRCLRSLFISFRLRVSCISFIFQLAWRTIQKAKLRYDQVNIIYQSQHSSVHIGLSTLPTWHSKTCFSWGASGHNQWCTAEITTIR